MKTLPLILAALVLCGCKDKRRSVSFENAQGAPVKMRLPKLTDDFVMGSETAVSNAIFFGKPPPGFEIFCSPDGSFVPAVGGVAMDALPESIRSNKWEAVVSCWRLKEIWDAPPPPTARIELGKAKAWEKCE